MKTLITVFTLVASASSLACTTDSECFKLAAKEITQAIKYKCLPEAAKALESLERDILNYDNSELKTCLIRAKQAQKFNASIARLKKKLNGN